MQCGEICAVEGGDTTLGSTAALVDGDSFCMCKAKDPNTGSSYYYNMQTKEVIFTDDRGCPGESCPWLLSLLPTPPPAAMNDAKRAFLAGFAAGGGTLGNKDAATLPRPAPQPVKYP